MARFDYYSRLEGPGYVLDIQTDLLRGLNTRVVVPLLPPAEAPLPAERLNPAFEIDGLPHVMITQFMAAVPLADLGRPAGSLAEHHTTIINAVDMLLSGY